MSLSTTSLDNNNHIFAKTLIVLSVLSVYYYIFWSSGFSFFYDDAYEYLSYAESLHKLGFIRNFTIYPDAPPITTQNGIVFVFYFLMFFTSNKSMILDIVSFVLMFNLLFIFYMVFKIGLFLKISRQVLFFLLIAFSFNFYFYAYYVMPINDGFYVSLSLISIYMFMHIFTSDDSSNTLISWFCLAVVSLILPIFRLQGLVIFVAALLTFLIVYRDYKKAFFSLFLLFLSYVSTTLVLDFSINDFSGIESLTNHSLFSLFSVGFFLSIVYSIFTQALPSMFLSFSSGNISFLGADFLKLFFSCSVFIFSFLYFIKSFFYKSAFLFFLLAIVFGNFVVLLLFTVVVDRYIYMNLALLMLVFLSLLRNRVALLVAFLFVLFSISIFSFRVTHVSYDAKKVISNIKYFNENIEQYQLISQIPRHTYFYLDKPSEVDFSYIRSGEPIVLIGNDAFINEKKRMILKDFNIVYENSLPVSWEKEHELYSTIEIGVQRKSE